MPTTKKTGIAGYTLVYSSRTMSLRTHQPFESAEKAVKDNLDIISQKNILETENHRILVEDTDEGEGAGGSVCTTSSSWWLPISWAGSLRLGAKTTSGKESATAMYLVFCKIPEKEIKILEYPARKWAKQKIIKQHQTGLCFFCESCV